MLETKTFFVHSVVTVLGLAWSFLISQPGLAVVLGILWFMTLIVYFEFKNSF